MLDPQAVLYGEIRGMLSAFALLTFDDVVDIGYTFTFEYLKMQENALVTLENHTNKFADEVTFYALPDWKDAFLALFKEWFFNKLVFPPWYKRQWLDEPIKELIKKIEQVVQPTIVWRVEMDWNKAKHIYPLFWQNFALGSEDGVYFLHLSLQD